MSIFSRLGDIINSNLTAMLDKAENPEQIARLIVQEMEDTLVEVRQAAARAIADKRAAEREIGLLTRERDDWAAKAELALAKSREDLARGALTARRKVDAALEARKVSLGGMDEAIGKTTADLEKLEAKLDEAKSRHRSLILKRDTAEGRVKLREAIYGDKADEVIFRSEQMARRIEELEAMAETWTTREGGIRAAFEELEGAEAIEKELADLKKKLKK